MSFTKFYIGKNKIEIWEDTKTIRTTFPDGNQLVAAPSNNEHEIKMMKELNFNDAWEMCKSHEILHTSIAVGEGKEYSRGLYRAVQGIEPDNEDYEEEAKVLRIQTLINHDNNK